MLWDFFLTQGLVKGVMFNFYLQKRATIKDDILSGLTVALALIPEAVAFSFVAGVQPLVGLYTAFIVGFITAVVGGRPGIISGATGALGGNYDRTRHKAWRRIPVY